MADNLVVACLLDCGGGGVSGRGGSADGRGLGRCWIGRLGRRRDIRRAKEQNSEKYEGRSFGHCVISRCLMKRARKGARRQVTLSRGSAVVVLTASNERAIGVAMATAPAVHYPNAGERLADQWVHVVGLAAGGLGGLTLLGLSLGMGRLKQTAAIGVYAACLLTMFLCSAAYNLASPRRRPLLRRLDHAAIFLMIAGSYTPFTTQRLTGAWAWGMTGVVWALALAGAAGKLFLPGLGRGFWVVLYLALGWVALIAIGPLYSGVSIPALALLLAGGLIYSAGVIVYLRENLPFRRAIWHGFVVVAAATQYVAVLTGVVLAARA